MQRVPKKKAVKRRDGVATRQAILESAMLEFTRSGYDGVGVREIAQGAGVTAMLVNRYFGSKEELFSEAVEVILSRRGVLAEEIGRPDRDLASFGRNVAQAFVALTAPNADIPDGILVMLRSAANERAAGILRKKVEVHFERRLADILPGPRAKERAAMILCVLAGFKVMRQVFGVKSLVQADVAHLRADLASLLQHLAEPPAT
jgi:AcrR family transcriptional regulator